MKVGFKPLVDLRVRPTGPSVDALLHCTMNVAMHIRDNAENITPVLDEGSGSMQKEARSTTKRDTRTMLIDRKSMRQLQNDPEKRPGRPDAAMRRQARRSRLPRRDSQ